MSLANLPDLNAALNGLATLLLIAGLVLIKRGRVDAHRNAMLAAFGVSILFLISYLTYHIWKAMITGEGPTLYRGPARGAYIAMLISHVILAAAVPVLAIIMIRLGLKGRIAAHKKLAWVAYPIWLYVSITGVLIYFVLYHLNPPAA